MSALNGAAKFGGDDGFLDDDDEPDSDDDGAYPAAPTRTTCISPTCNAALPAASAATADLPDLDDAPGDINTTGATRT